jgi:hypothetical protein
MPRLQAGYARRVGFRRAEFEKQLKELMNHAR